MKYYSTTKHMHGLLLREARSRRGWRPTGTSFVLNYSVVADMASRSGWPGSPGAALAGYLAALFFGEDIDAGILQRRSAASTIFRFPCVRSAAAIRWFCSRPDVRVQRLRRRIHGPHGRPAGRRGRAW